MNYYNIMQEKIIEEVKVLLKGALDGKVEFSVKNGYTEVFNVIINNIIIRKNDINKALSLDFIEGHIVYKNISEIDYLEIKTLFLKLSFKYESIIYRQLNTLNNSLK